MYRSAIVLLFILIGFSPILAQEECAVKLREAETRYNEGLIEEVPGLLEACLETGFTAADELSAYKLLIRCLLFDDENDAAENAMLEFLKKYPEYEISPTDAADFIYLFNQYRVKPVIQVGVHGGGILSYITGIKNEENKLPVSSLPGDASYSNDQTTFSAGLDIRFKLSEKFEIGLEADYTELTYRYKEDILNFALDDYFEKQQKLEASATGYYVPTVWGRFSPFVKLGSGVGYNISTKATILLEPTDINNPGKRTGPVEDRHDFRIPLDVFVHPGLGMKFKLPSSYLYMDISTRISFRYQSKAAIPGNVDYYYMHSDNRFGLNSLRFTAGYIFIFYKPEKLEE